MAVLRESLASGDTETAAAAASAMGRSGALGALTDDDVRLLLAATERPFPVPMAATYALARLARSGRFGTASEGERAPLRAGVSDALCALLDRREPHVRANVLVALGALRRIGLKGREDLPSRVLSQGQKRRVALARLLCSQARLWVLDEPFVALDVAAVAQLCEILDEHLARGGLLVFTSHQAVQLGGTGASLRLGQ